MAAKGATKAARSGKGGSPKGSRAKAKRSKASANGASASGSRAAGAKTAKTAKANGPGSLEAVPAPGSSAAGRGTKGPDASIEGLHPPKKRRRSASFITDVIVELGFASREAVDKAIADGRQSGASPEDLLLAEQAINPDQLSRAIAERYGVDYLDLSAYRVDMAAANLLSVPAARRYRAVPVGYVDKGTLLVATADPANVLAIDDIQMASGLNCHVAVAPEEDIEALVAKLNTLQSAVSQAVADSDEEDEDEGADLTDLRASAEDAPVIKLVNSILGQAVGEGASDIHFEPTGDEMRVRMRVDGSLYEAARVPRKMVAGVVTRVKVMSELDIAEKRLPQDGRASVAVEDHQVDLRITTLPTQRGEGATIRILDESKALLSLDELGLGGDARKRFESAVKNPYGAILVTGPTGSGKSTSLYAALQILNEESSSIITIEDPVEYRLDGINQINVNPKAGLSFASGLRSILRADPDIIMVGEVRDTETARIATEAALTGHLVLTTLHTNDAPGAVARLTEMGIEPFLTASAVDCIAAQRLARRLCKHCKKKTVLTAKVLAEHGMDVGGDLKAHEAVGCRRCNRSGYRGRVGLFSIMVMSDEIKELTVERAPEAEIARVAHEQGMSTLREAGLEKVRAGATSVEEIVRVSR